MTPKCCPPPPPLDPIRGEVNGPRICYCAGTARLQRLQNLLDGLLALSRA